MRPTTPWVEIAADSRPERSQRTDTAHAAAPPAASRGAPSNRLMRIIGEELAGLHLRLLVARALLAILPIHVGGRVRVAGLRLAGFRIGRGTIMAGMPVITGERAGAGDADIYDMLRIGSGCWLNIDCLFDLGASITIGNQVSFGHGVMVLTSTHQMGPPSQRAGGRIAQPVSIGDGAWLGSRCIIFPGVKIGAGAVVAAGAVVKENVPANRVVAGVPARIVKILA